MKPAPRAGGWCNIEKVVEGTVVKEVKGTDKRVLKENTLSCLFS